MLTTTAREPLVIAGVSIQRLTKQEALASIVAKSILAPVRVVWVYANCINIARKDVAYRQALAECEFVLNDGAGIEIASHMFHRPVLENLCGTDLIPEILDSLHESQGEFRLFFVGSKAENLDAVRIEVQRRWPKAKLVGLLHGYFTDPADTLAAIAASRPQVLVVGLGVPRQEMFLTEHWQALTAAGVSIAMAGGAIIDHLSGNVTRAPVLLQRLRLEWVYRVATEPRRLWRRYLIGNLIFLFGVLRDRWRISA